MEKLKANGEYEEFKRKKAASEKERRQRQKAGMELLPKAEREKLKRLNRTYMRKKNAEHRQRKKAAPAPAPGDTTTNVTSTSSESETRAGYNTKSALDKAVAKVKRALPSTTTKKKEVVSKLLLTFGEDDRSDIIANHVTTTKARPTRALKSAVVESVISFYERDDISRMSPNMRDCRKFVDPKTGLKEEKQIRHLMYKLSDVYSMFLRHVQNGKFMWC